MKRENEKTPGFDDVIFQDRNKEYGAYDLRKRYGSTMSVSIVAVMIFGISLVLVPFFTAEPDPGPVIPTGWDNKPVITDLSKPPDYVPPELPKPPDEIIKKAAYLPPEVVAGDVTVSDIIPTVDDRLDTSNKPSDDPTWDEPVDNQATIPPEDPPVVFVPEMPEFPGGQEELLKFIYDHIVYPEEAIANNLQGTVILRFVVSKTGDITDIEVLRSIDPLLDNESIRVISMMPRWHPGKQDGVPVRVYFSVPVTFKIGVR